MKDVEKRGDTTPLRPAGSHEGTGGQCLGYSPSVRAAARPQVSELIRKNRRILASFHPLSTHGRGRRRRRRAARSAALRACDQLSSDPVGESLDAINPGITASSEVGRADSGAPVSSSPTSSRSAGASIWIPMFW